MKIPKKLKIGGIWYKVDQVATSNSGMADITKSSISINKDMAQPQKEVTLLHEILHCINIQLKDEPIEFLAQALYQVLKDNKLLKED